MNRTLFIAICLLVLSVCKGYGQSDSRPLTLNSSNYKEVIKKSTAAMQAALSLTNAQLEAIIALEEGLSAQLFSLESSTTLAERKKVVESLQQQREEGLRKVLTLKQWEAYSTHIAQQKQKVLQGIEERRQKRNAQPGGG